jgi:hypothetical protein
MAIYQAPFPPSICKKLIVSKTQIKKNKEKTKLCSINHLRHIDLIDPNANVTKQEETHLRKIERYRDQEGLTFLGQQCPKSEL